MSGTFDQVIVQIIPAQFITKFRDAVCSVNDQEFESHHFSEVL